MRKSLDIVGTIVTTLSVLMLLPPIATVIAAVASILSTEPLRVIAAVLANVNEYGAQLVMGNRVADEVGFAAMWILATIIAILWLAFRPPVHVPSKLVYRR